MDIGNSIKKIRKDKLKMNQQDFSKSIGITQTYLSQIETGIKTPRVIVLQKISVEFEIPLPIIFWLSLSEEDVVTRKREYFNLLKPSIDEMIKLFY